MRRGQREERNTGSRDLRRDIINRRGKHARHIATVATARHMMKVVYYTMRDGHARCLDAATPVAS